MLSMSTDEKWMRRALLLARKGRGHVSPNPMVGAVIVRNGKKMAEGFHSRYGGPHAEVEALAKAGARAKGSTLYVTLEPCSHWGKTGPCVEAVKKAGIVRVVAAGIDPFPLVSGQGVRRLKKFGIRVTVGTLRRQAEKLNRQFILRARRKRPYVILKSATSFDGKVATARGESQWITSSAARREGHRLRASMDAIAVGIETVLKDNPVLSAHGHGKNPRKIIFDSHLRLPLRAKIFAESPAPWVFTTARAFASRRRSLLRKGAEVYVVRSNSHGRPDLRESLQVLAARGISRLLVEGGPTLLAAFLEAQAADELRWFMAPLLIGGAHAKSAIEGNGISALKNAWEIVGLKAKRVGRDFYWRGKLRF